MVGQLTRARPSNAFENDARIRDMAMTQLAVDGLEGLTLGNVARNLGMSHTAMSKRYGQLDDLLCDLWTNIAVAQIDTILGWIAGEVKRINDPKNDAKAASDATLFRKTKEKLVTLELLALNPTRPKLREVVQQTFEQRLGELAKNHSIQAAQTVFLFAMVIGILGELRSTSANREALAQVTTAVIDAMATPGEVIKLPRVDASHMRRYDFNTGDIRRDQILMSCLRNVGRRGFVQTTTKSIAHDAGVSEGLIFSMFASKADIFFEATSLQSELGFQANLDFVVSLNEQYGTGVANAILIREWLSPDLGEFRAALLEETRITWHDVDLWRRIYKVKEDLLNKDRVPGKKPSMTPFDKAVQMIALALPIGVYIVGEAFPAATELPFSVATLPVF
jgi:AcrR family transcriptional regulator